MIYEYANFRARDISRDGICPCARALDIHFRVRARLGRPATSGYTRVSGRLRSLEAARALTVGFLISDFGLISDF